MYLFGSLVLLVVVCLQTITCDVPEFTGTITATCNPDQTWTFDGSCSPVTCPATGLPHSTPAALLDGAALGDQVRATQERVAPAPVCSREAGLPAQTGCNCTCLLHAIEPATLMNTSSPTSLRQVDNVGGSSVHPSRHQHAASCAARVPEHSVCHPCAAGNCDLQAWVWCPDRIHLCHHYHCHLHIDQPPHGRLGCRPRVHGHFLWRTPRPLQICWGSRQSGVSLYDHQQS
jgi:hypothetical protein